MVTTILTLYVFVDISRRSVTFNPPQDVMAGRIKKMQSKVDTFKIDFFRTLEGSCNVVREYQKFHLRSCGHYVNQCSHFS